MSFRGDEVNREMARKAYAQAWDKKVFDVMRKGTMSTWIGRLVEACAEHKKNTGRDVTEVRMSEAEVWSVDLPTLITSDKNKGRTYLWVNGTQVSVTIPPDTFGLTSHSLDDMTVLSSRGIFHVTVYKQGHKPVTYETLSDAIDNYPPTEDDPTLLVNLLEDRVVRWAEDRNLIKGSNPIAQLGKTLEECGELLVALNSNDKEETKDAYGDILVTLIIGMAQSNLSVAECLSHAYEQIKDRKGRMVNGVFVKEK